MIATATPSLVRALMRSALAWANTDAQAKAEGGVNLKVVFPLQIPAEFLDPAAWEAELVQAERDMQDSWFGPSEPVQA
jgi:hypothetical protein